MKTDSESLGGQFGGGGKSWRDDHEGDNFVPGDFPRKASSGDLPRKTFSLPSNLQKSTGNEIEKDLQMGGDHIRRRQPESLNLARR